VNGCNRKNKNHSVTAGVTSDDEDVATTSVATLTFTDCDQTLSFTIIAGCTDGDALISIDAIRWKAASGKNAVFSDDSFTVTVSGTAENCDDGGGSACAAPAAPAWAAAILKANNLKAKQATNLVSEVAKMMGQGATFNGVAKSNQEEYAQAVYNYLDVHGRLSQTSGPGDAARPGWICTNLE
jgi:hypothetical protein